MKLRWPFMLVRTHRRRTLAMQRLIKRLEKDVGHLQAQYIDMVDALGRMNAELRRSREEDPEG